jgi:hypothetical protein
MEVLVPLPENARQRQSERVERPLACSGVTPNGPFGGGRCRAGKRGLRFTSIHGFDDTKSRADLP